MLAHTFDHTVRVLLCSSCGAPLELDLASATAACGYCGASNVLVARDDAPMAERPASAPIDEAERRVRLRRQTGRALTTPPGLEALVPKGRLDPWKVQEVFAVWQSTRQETRTTGGFDAAERLLYLTMVLANHHATDDRLRQRAMFESALVVLTLPRHRQAVRGFLSRAAAREGDLEAAAAWLAPCDTTSDDLETDTAWRISRAYLDTARKDWPSVVELLGTAADAVPIADASVPMAHLIRANAVEREGNVSAAEALLRSAMAGGAKNRAALATLRGLHREWDLCPRSYPRAEAGYTATAAKSAGGMGSGVGSVFYWVGLLLNAVTLLAILAMFATGAVALGLGALPAIVQVPARYRSELAAVASACGVAAFTFAVALPTTLPMGLVFWGIGRGLRNAGIRAQRLRLHGRPGTAQVLSLKATGMSINDVPQMEVKLRVELPDAAPYEAVTKLLLPPHEAARLAGATVSVRVDPKDPTAVLIEAD